MVENETRERGPRPIHKETVLDACGDEEACVVRVRDTMHLERIEVSPALVEEAAARDDLRVVSDPEPVAFDEDGQYEIEVLDA